MATAQSYQVNLPDISVPNSTEYHGDNLVDSGTGKDLMSRIGRLFGGYDYEQEYQNALTENNRAYELALLKEQRAYDEYVRGREYGREDTKYQRMIADMKAAGLNPWLALQGGISGSSAQGQPASNGNFERGSSAKAEQSKSTGIVASLLSAIAKVLVS